VRWSMLLTIGEPGDPGERPDTRVADEPEELKVGTLDDLVRDDAEGRRVREHQLRPARHGDGIAPTDDPVLLFARRRTSVDTKRLQGL